MEKSKKELDRDRAIIPYTLSDDMVGIVDCIPKEQCNALATPVADPSKRQRILEHMDFTHLVDQDEMGIKLERAAADVLFNKMSYVCTKAFVECNLTNVGFSQAWFEATFCNSLERSMRSISILTYPVCQPLLSKHPDLFQKHMAKFGLKCLDDGSFDILSIAFEADKSFWTD